MPPERQGLFRVSFEVAAPSHLHALAAVDELMHDPVHHRATVSMKIEALTRRRMVRQCAGWGLALGLVFATYCLYCLGIGFDPFLWIEELDLAIAFKLLGYAALAVSLLGVAVFVGLALISREAPPHG